ncbi:uncharacterized protein LOC129598300 isoform X2 [Paramacrobiotus metropolitanus]|nr:uncharacterized protein LOC129598300 isoform X2 [Paramacrobiotus metropolitanus]XP_055352110.1 uncharacterized protein LOC129598300 isoform X2 [Paramacrobiotus metropolitanus]XP_055352111.1 uncharacterized protein LOC129598300 isoform X2 [Paramacrobiotus metropolitanus]XP_055352112.1 uncharacterized protein LOC129598300 isoform X2 [Paramacrobiotus metropolitanus]XP_055352113.1 uncharacterized protein LOC129598300 isoform X2 [Paramacrobiotus metropolitanus]
MVAPASLPPFQRVLRGSDGFSYQNTVAVWTTDGAWWLGYIQDIAADGQHAYIDFDSSKTAASWVPTGAIWSLAFLFDDRSLAEGGWENMAVQVALRDEMDGPFRFRPATLLNRAFCQIYYVSTAVRGTDSQAGSFAAVEVVDRCQIAAQLPTGELPVQHLSSAVTYTKHVIAFPGAASLLVEAADVSRIITHFRRAYQQLDIDPSANFFLDSWTDDDSLTDGCRFHLRIAKETCDFVIVTGNKDARTRTQQQISSTLNGVLHRHLHSRAQLPPLRCRNVVHISNGGPHSDNAAININLYMAPDSEDSEAGTCIRICHLPQLILMEIFANLDLQAQMLIKRVCSLWHAILSCNPGTHKDHITISLEGCSFNTCQNDHCYKVASMLNRAVSCSSRSLTINGSGRGQQHAFFLEPWLQVTNAQP